MHVCQSEISLQDFCRPIPSHPVLSLCTRLNTGNTLQRGMCYYDLACLLVLSETSQSSDTDMRVDQGDVGRLIILQILSSYPLTSLLRYPYHNAVPQAWFCTTWLQMSSHTAR